MRRKGDLPFSNTNASFPPSRLPGAARCRVLCIALTVVLAVVGIAWRHLANILHHDRLKVTATSLSGMISMAQTAASWHAETYRCTCERDPTDVPMMRAVPTCNVHPLRLADLHKVLPRQFDRALIRLGPGQEEESVREITRTQCGIWALGDLGTREFCSETRRKKVITERPGHNLGEGTINGQTALSPNKIHL